jgi:cytochrome c oxidase subunit 4
MTPKGHSPNVKAYLAVFAALMALTVVTVGVSYLHLPKTAGILVGLLIATFKAALVAAFFMHLKGERQIIYGLLGLTLFFMAVLFILPIADIAGLEPAIMRPAAEAAPAEAH